MDRTNVHWAHRWLPASPSIDRVEAFRSCMGALVGIFVTGVVGLMVLGPSHAGTAWLMAPMGASAVLLFAVPSSPLAQPWSLVGGNCVAGVVGVTAARWIPEPAVAAPVAISVAVAAMLALRCLHPPSGAVALMAVLGGADIRASGYAFVVTPVLLNSAVILASALAYNRLTGRRYPHGPLRERTRDGPGSSGVDVAPRIGFDEADIAAALTRYNQVLDVSPADLGELLRHLETQVHRRRFGDTTCRQVMSTGGPTVVFATELAEAWALMKTHGVAALPVLDRARYVVGIVTRGDFLDHADRVDRAGLGARISIFLARTAGARSDKVEVVGQIMTTSVLTVGDTSPLLDLVMPMVRCDLRHVPVVDAQSRFVGMVAQVHALAALHETILAQASLLPPPSTDA